MKIFAFIKKEKADIDLVDAKLAKFETIFNGMVTMSKSSKRLFEMFRNRLDAAKGKLESLAENKTIGSFVEPSKLNLQADKLTGLIGIYSKFLDQFDLGPIGTLRDSFSMRRQTIQANCGAMEGKLDEEYKQFEAANAEYQKRTFKLQEHFMNTAETFQNPKSYFDVSYMYSALNELKSELQQAEKLEAQAIAQTTEVYALATLFNNSIKDLTHNTLKSKKIVLDLLQHGSDGLKNLALDHIAQSKELTMEGILDSTRINNFFGDYYKNFHDLYLSSENEQGGENVNKFIDDLASLAQGHFLPNENLLGLAESSVIQFTLALSKAVDFETSLSDASTKIIECITLIKNFDEQYTKLKAKLQAASDSDVFYKTLYSNYNTEMNFVIKNYFIFFDIIQKAIRKLFKNTVDSELAALEKRLAAKNEKLGAKRAEIIEILKAIQELEVEARKSGGSTSNLFVNLATTIKDLNKEMRNFLTISFHELEVFIHEPIQLLYRFLGGMEKMFTEISEHADIEHSFLSVIDDSEGNMLETLKADHFIKALLDKQVEVDSKNHLVFNAEFDIQKYFSAYRNMHSEWMRDVGGFLKADGLIKHSVLEKAKEEKPGDKNIPAEVKHYLELSEEDTTMALTYRFDTRMNRKNIPHNGVISMMNDYFVFYANSIAGIVNLTVPYDLVTDLQPKKNFIGQNNGLLVEVKNGSLEFYLASNSKREEFCSKLAELREVHKVGMTSAIRKEYTKRSYYLIFNEKEKKTSREELTEEQTEHLGMRLQFCFKKMRVGVFNCDNLVYSKQVQNANIHSLINLWFGIKPYMYSSIPHTNFMYHWRDQNNCTSQEICTTGQLPDYITKGSTDFDDFLPSSVHISTLTFFENAQKQKVKEKITLIFTHVDQIACIISATSGQKLEYECLMLIRQGQASDGEGTPFDSSAESEPKADSVVIKMWRRRGLKPEAHVKGMYSEKFIEFMVEVGQHKAAAARGEDSKFEAMT